MTDDYVSSRRNRRANVKSPRIFIFPCTYFVGQRGVFAVREFFCFAQKIRLHVENVVFFFHEFLFQIFDLGV